MHGNDVNGEDIKQHNKIRERVLIRWKGRNCTLVGTLPLDSHLSCPLL